MLVWELYTQLFARNSRCGRFARSLSRGCSEKIRKKDVVMTAERWSSWSIQIPQFLMLWWPAMKAGPTDMTQRPRNIVPSGSMLALPDPRRPVRANPSTNLWWSLFWQHWHDPHALGSHLTDSRQGILCWGFNGVQEDSVGSGKHSSNRVSGISNRTMHQSTTPFLSQTIWPRWASRHFVTLAIVQTLLPVTFAYSLSSRKTLEAVVMRQLKRWKRLWHAHTSGFPWGLPEVFGTVEQVHCSRKRLLRRGLKTYVCSINKSTHTKKVWKLI